MAVKCKKNRNPLKKNNMIKAKLRHLRISPRKVRLVTDLIKGLDVKKAQKQLEFSPKGVATPILKLLNSAIANARHNANLDENNLYISSILVDPGPTLKRWMPRAMGRATSIMKRTSHITISLEERIPSINKKDKIKKEEKKEMQKDSLPQTDQIEESKETSQVKSIQPERPYATTPESKKRFFSRQPLENKKKIFRRKKI